MSQFIQRKQTVVSVSVAQSATDSAVIDKRGYSRVGIAAGTALTSGTITYKVANGSADTFLPLRDAGGTLVSALIAADVAVVGHDALAPWPFFKISGAAEAAARTYSVALQG